MDDIALIVAAEAAAAVPLAIVVFGRDEAGRAHASCFEAADAPLAERAAGLMGFRALHLATIEQQELAAKLPAGRTYEKTGRAFVPYCNTEVFTQFAADPAAFSPERPPEAEVPPAAPRKAKGARSAAAASKGGVEVQDGARGPDDAPADRAAIAIGHRVLAAEDDLELWYSAEVIALKGPDLVELRWTSPQWAGWPPVIRHRDHLALLPAALAASPK